MHFDRTLYTDPAYLFHEATTRATNAHSLANSSSAWHNSGMRYLGIDFGTKNVGLALSDENGMMAFPLRVLSNSRTLVKDILSVIEEKKVDALVIGHSRSHGGADNPVEMHTTAFITELRELWQGEIFREDELYTSREAEQIQGRNEMIDASAATLILNSYFTRLSNKTDNQHTS